ncbi:photosynthetic complex assembly protein PuhC [Jannaschia marina]|uniref:photosynthetic complex assembly protein PuhC n=1 Tax=Jannaschia marina TaxID=2741674 RepID=UPI0015C6EE1A|nr:photosynthetic complex assembly protein PuhC [Jannaschia marina]
MARTETASLANQMKHRDREMVPRFLVVAMFTVMAASVALVGFARLTDRPLEGTRAPVAITQELTLTMRGDRAAGVGLHTADGTRVAHSGEPRKGFIGVIATSIDRARQVKGAPADAPIRVVRRADGSTAILDDASGWSIVLIGHGKDNVAAFADLLDS